MARKDGKKLAGKAMVAGAGHFLELQPVEPLHGVVMAEDDASELATEVSPSQDEAAMVRRATEVLGLAYVADWMRTSIPSLGNQTPYALLKSEQGRKQVERVLLKIEHGVY